MKLRALFVLAIVLLACAGALWLWPTGGESLAPVAPVARPATTSPAPSSSASVSPTPKPSVVPAAATPEPLVPAEPVRIASAVMPGQPIVRSTPAPATPAAKGAAAPAAAPISAKQTEKEGAREMEDVRSMFRDFHTRLGENPVGSNAEIMKAVMGGNSAGARLGPPLGQELNGDGELVDRWGTPYFFHQLAKDKMEVRSAGPDLRMWTTDDLVTK